MTILLSGTAGLFLFLWAGLVAPVVLWSDSRLDLDWARTGAGIFRPLPAPSPGQVLAHPAKTGYLLFLRAAMAAVPGVPAERSVVLVQSVLLWGSIAATAVFVARRRGSAAGFALYALLLAFLRLRDSASAVMTEALSAALFLPLAAAALAPPKRDRTLLGIGAASALLFSVRPNLALVAAALVAASLSLARRPRGVAAFAVAFLLLSSGFWLATRRVTGEDAWRGAGYPILGGSAEYYWQPSIPWPPPGVTRPPTTGTALALTRDRWERFFAGSAPDVRRELVWRALHGVFGVEYYDAGWSALYAVLDRESRIVSPFLILAGIAAAAAGVFGADRRAGVLAALLLAMLVVHDLVFGSNPRYLLPALPALPLVLVFVLSGVAPDRRKRRRLSAAFLAALAVLVLFAAVWPQLFDWQWGRLDSAGDAISQTIPRGEIPPGRSTLHVRIGAAELPSGARYALEGPGGRPIALAPEATPDRAFATAEIPSWLAAENASRDVDVRVVASGELGPGSFLLFPVVPPPFCRRRAQRDGVAAGELSPSTGIRSGCLDMWVHSGHP
ncbi:MAG: hypothetical protein ABI592_14660 [Acidobacteriota bacterium]